MHARRKAEEHLDSSRYNSRYYGYVQLSFSSKGEALEARSCMADLRDGQAGIIESIDLPSELATRLMELGFLPGTSVTAAQSAPGGDPKIFRVDGSEIALRQETAARLRLRT